MTMLSLLLTLGQSEAPSTTPTDHPTKESPMMLFDFTENVPPWRVIDDGVMGGRSAGHWRVDEGTALFSGRLSLENNGGFSSVRSAPVGADCSGYGAIQIRVRGDGRTYQFRVRTTAAFDGPSYRSEFETTAGTWQEVTLPIAGFQASFRGRALPNHPKLTAEAITTVGFLLADKQPGEFALEIDHIRLLAEIPES
jgi:monofunctional biosynthetic peptidoglycan transglycosylase